jgi:hypothetical protein
MWVSGHELFQLLMGAKDVVSPNSSVVERASVKLAPTQNGGVLAAFCHPLVTVERDIAGELEHAVCLDYLELFTVMAVLVDEMVEIESGVHCAMLRGNNVTALVPLSQLAVDLTAGAVAASAVMPPMAVFRALASLSPFANGSMVQVTIGQNMVIFEVTDGGNAMAAVVSAEAGGSFSMKLPGLFLNAMKAVCPLPYAQLGSLTIKLFNNFGAALEIDDWGKMAFAAEPGRDYDVAMTWGQQSALATAKCSGGMLATRLSMLSDDWVTLHTAPGQVWMDDKHIPAEVYGGAAITIPRQRLLDAIHADQVRLAIAPRFLAVFQELGDLRLEVLIGT